MNIFNLLNIKSDLNWSKKVLKFYIGLIIVSTLIRIFYIYTHNLEPFEYIKCGLFLSSYILTIVLACVTYKRLKNKDHLPFYITAFGNIVGLLTVFMHQESILFEFVLVFTLVISSLYFSKAVLMFSKICFVVSTVFIFLCIPDYFVRHSVLDLAGFIFIFSGVMYLNHVIISKGESLIEQMEQLFHNKQELLVKNVLMERSIKIDALTQLYNHITFFEYLDELIIHSNKHNLRLYLAIIDIDNFKNINDTYGHKIGDIILKRISENIKRHSDLNDFVARYGGEEFVIVFTDKTLDEVYRICESIRKDCAAMVHEELENQPVTVSIGLLQYDKSMNKNSFFEETDKALYSAKNSGKNKVCCPQLNK